MPASNKQTTLRGCGFPKVGCYTLHGSLTSPYKAGFLTSGSSLLFPFSYYRTMGYWKVAPLLQWPDRSGFAPDSLFWLLRGLQSALHMFNMELYWHHNNTMPPCCQQFICVLSFFYQYTCKQLPIYWSFNIFKNASAFLHSPTSSGSEMNCRSEHKYS